MSHSRCVDSHALKSASPPSSKLWQSSKSEKALLYRYQESFSGTAAVLRPCRAVSHLLGSLHIFYWHSNLALFLYAALFIVLCRGGSYVVDALAELASRLIILVWFLAARLAVCSFPAFSAHRMGLRRYQFWRCLESGELSAPQIGFESQHPRPLSWFVWPAGATASDGIYCWRCVSLFSHSAIHEFCFVFFDIVTELYNCVCARAGFATLDGYWAGSWSDAGGIVDDLPSLFM